MKKRHLISLTEEDIDHIITALVFTYCCDVNLDYEKKKIRIKPLKLANKLSQITDIKINKNLYLLDNFEYEDDKESKFLIKNMGIRLESVI